LVIWHEIIALAKDSQTPILFVTDDLKKDWWRQHKGKTVGPHPSLKREFESQTGQLFHMYNPLRFFEYASEYFRADLHESALDEVRATQERAAKHIHEEYQSLTNRLEELDTAINENQRELQQVDEAQQEYKDRISEIDEEMKRILDSISGADSNDAKSFYADVPHDVLQDRFDLLHKERHELEHKLDELRTRRARIKDAIGDIYANRSSTVEHLENIHGRHSPSRREREHSRKWKRRGNHY
jgi:chromosome segregation ATPase